MAISRATNSKRLVSAIQYLDKRSINPGVVDEANDAAFSGTLEAFGRKSTVPSNQWNYKHFVNSDLIKPFVVDSVTGTGTATLAITLTVAGGSGFVRTGTTMRTAAGKLLIVTSAITTAASKDSFTAKSVDGSNVTLAAAGILSYAGTTVGEQSVSVSNLFYDQTPYENLIQAFRETDVITDVQSAAEVETKAPDGTMLYNYVQYIQKAQLFKLGIDSAFIQGVKSSTQFSDASPALTDLASNPIQTTDGLDSYVTTRGVNDSTATLGTLLLTDYDDLFDKITAVKGPSEYMSMGSNNVLNKNADLFGNLGGNGLSSVKLELDGASPQNVNLNVQRMQRGRFSLEFMRIPIFDHPQLLNYTGAGTISKSLYGIPKDSVKTTTGVQPRIQIRYMKPQVKNAMGSETTAEFYDGALAPQGPIGDGMFSRCNWVSYQGLECLGTKQFFKHQVLA